MELCNLFYGNSDSSLNSSVPVTEKEYSSNTTTGFIQDNSEEFLAQLLLLEYDDKSLPRNTPSTMAVLDCSRDARFRFKLPLFLPLQLQDNNALMMVAIVYI